MLKIFESENKQRTIIDPVHSHIRISAVENEILKMPAMNRLHDIRSLSLADLVFPGATASRFSHSLGTMKLASDMCEQILASISRKGLFSSIFKDQKDSDREWVRIIQTVRIAALMHDIGHGPYSHSTESFMHALLSRNVSETEEFEQLFPDAKKSNSSHVHEYFSIKIIEKILAEPELVSSGTEIEARDVTCLLSRNMKPSALFSTTQALLLFRKIISSEIDADRMDYVLRDSLYTGARFGEIDSERIISSIEIVEQNSGQFSLGFQEKALGNIEDFIDSRYKMYKWVVRHHLMASFDQLLRFTIYDLLSEGKLKLEMFHWTRFLHGRSSDSSISSLIHEEAVERNLLCRSLLDRRYAPVSLFKGRSDAYSNFEQEIGKKISLTHRKMDPETAISDYIRRINAPLSDPEIEDGIPRIEIGNKPAVILALSNPIPPFESGDALGGVNIFDGIKLRSMGEVSSYFTSLNNEWNNFKPYYISFLIPGEKKADYSSQRIIDQVQSGLSDVIAETS